MTNPYGVVPASAARSGARVRAPPPPSPCDAQGWRAWLRRPISALRGTARLETLEATRQSSCGEGLFDVPARLGQVRPPFVMKRNDRCVCEGARSLDGFICREGEMCRSDFQHAGRAHEQHGNL